MSQYANGITTIDKLVQAVYTIATTVVVPNEWYNIFSMRDKYQAECRSVVSNFDKYDWDKSQLASMASAYKAMKDAVDNQCYPNVVEGTNL